MCDRTISELRRERDRLLDLIEAGVSEVTTDGSTTRFDLKAARDALRRIEKQLPENKARRPRVARIRLDL